KGSMLLSNKYKHLFTNKQIVCIEYQDLPDTDEQERDFRHFLCSCKFDSVCDDECTHSRGSNWDWHSHQQVSMPNCSQFTIAKITYTHL
ncbi:hypothetical protein EDD16DRAFT_1481689, partial [Pisolithus croceorrhizus]